MTAIPVRSAANGFRDVDCRTISVDTLGPRPIEKECSANRLHGGTDGKKATNSACTTAPKVLNRNLTRSPGNDECLRRKIQKLYQEVEDSGARRWSRFREALFFGATSIPCGRNWSVAVVVRDKLLLLVLQEPQSFASLGNGDGMTIISSAVIAAARLLQSGTSRRLP